MRNNINKVIRFQSWKQFYGTSNIDLKTTYVSNDESHKIFSGAQAIYITQSYFKKCRTTSTGGAIYYDSSSNSKMLIDYSMFIECESSLHGGAISMYLGGQLVLQFTCGDSCRTTGVKGGLFIHTNFKNSNYSTTKNYILDSSVTRSQNPLSDSVIGIQQGDIQCKRLNVSNNENHFWSSILCGGPYAKKDPSTPDAYLFQCSISYNNATSHCCIAMISEQSDNNIKIEQCNIIGNWQPENSEQGIIYSTCILHISRSCIKNNTGSPTLSTSSQIILHECWTSSITIEGSVEKEQESDYFVNSINIFASGACEADPSIVPKTSGPKKNHKDRHIVFNASFIQLPIFHSINCDDNK